MNKTTGDSKQFSSKAGLPPGTLIHIGRKKADHTRITVMDYGEVSFEEHTIQNIEDCLQYRDSETKSWINMDGIHDINVMKEIGHHYGLHNLLLEDILNTQSRPKLEEYDNHILMTLKMLGISKDRKSILTEQVSLVLGDTWLISFQEQEGDVFDPLRGRIREETSMLRKQGADYLFYRLIDTIVDNYFFVTEHLSEVLEELEEEVLSQPTNESRRKMQLIKKQLLQIKKAVTPLREAVGTLTKEDNKFIKKSTTRYLRDVYEHIIMVSEYIDSQRDILAGIMDLYVSGISNKMNQVMQVLTIISTIFIPLTFIAGIYGMNFDNMPELHMTYAYHTVWGVMVLVVIGMIVYFRRKNWL